MWMSKTSLLLALLSIASGCAAPVRPSCAPTTSLAATAGESAVRGPLWALAQCACRGKLGREMMREGPFPPPHSVRPGNYVQSWLHSERVSFWEGKYRVQVRWMSIPQDQCADGRPVEGPPIVLTLASRNNWLLGTIFAKLTVSEFNAYPSYKFSTSPGGDLLAAWRLPFPSDPSTDRQSWVPADVMDPEIRAAFEAEKSFWLAELGQIPPGPLPSPAAPSP